jgi:hypothetical protein
MATATPSRRSDRTPKNPPIYATVVLVWPAATAPARWRGTIGRIKPFEIGIKARQRVSHDLPDLPQRMAHRDALLKVDLRRVSLAILSVGASTHTARRPAWHGDQPAVEKGVAAKAWSVSPSRQWCRHPAGIFGPGQNGPRVEIAYMTALASIDGKFQQTPNVQRASGVSRVAWVLHGANGNGCKTLESCGNVLY